MVLAAVRELSREESGQDVIEYSLLIAFLTLVGAAIFPFGAESISAICSTTDANLVRAMQGLP